MNARGTTSKKGFLPVLRKGGSPTRCLPFSLRPPLSRSALDILRKSNSRGVGSALPCRLSQRLGRCLCFGGKSRNRLTWAEADWVLVLFEQGEPLRHQSNLFASVSGPSSPYELFSSIVDDYKGLIPIVYVLMFTL